MERLRSATSPGLRAGLLPAAVLSIAAAAAAMLYGVYLKAPRLLWTDAIHDRSAHLYTGMRLASDLSHGRLAELVRDINRMRSWPPLHDGVLVGIAAGIGRGDERWAVLPSLAGWVGAVVFAFLLARRCVRHAGDAAGLIAALLVLVSPAQRAFATDVMLESLGACLTLAVLYCYLLALQTGRKAAIRWFFIALAALFFEKYNYWALVVFGIALHQAARRAPVQLRLLLAGARARADDGRLSVGALVNAGRPAFNRAGTILLRCLTLLRHPLGWPAAAVFALMAVLALTGDWHVVIAGKPSILGAGGNLPTVAYVLVLLRVLPWYLSDGRHRVSRSSPWVRSLLALHVLPVAVWLLWPGKIAGFWRMLSPASNPGEFPDYRLWSGYRYYWSCLAHDYHIGLWSLAGVCILGVVGLWAAAHSRLRKGSGVIFCVLAIAALLTVHHPNRKSRFLHSWIPCVWVCAGIGAARLLRPRRRAGASVRRALLAGAVAAIAGAHVPGAWAAPHAPEGGIHPQMPSMLDATDAYLPDLAGSRRAAVFSNMPVKYAAQWTYLQRYDRRFELVTEIPHFAAGADPRLFHGWLAGTECDTIVLLEYPPGSPGFVRLPNRELQPGYGRLLREQTQFSLLRRQELSAYSCTITIWRRETHPRPRVGGAGS